MAVKQTKPTFQCSDGKEFPTQAEADRHEDLMVAKDEYETARRKFGIALAKTQKTADGKPFEFGIMRNYWYIRCWNSLPRLFVVDFYLWDFQFDERSAVQPHVAIAQGST